MYDILKLNKISSVINTVFGKDYSCVDACDNPDGIILRSYNMAEYNVGDKLLGIARAGAGVNNIPVDKMSEKGIVVFNTPGANANAVKELTICGMLIASRDIIGGNKWVNTLTTDVAKTTEKGKSNYGGTEICKKTLGVVGLGAIGIMVANACISLGMKVIGYDPFLSDENRAKLDESIEVVDLDTIYAQSDIITAHVPLLDSTKGMFNKEAFAKMKDGVILINNSRGALVNVNDIKDAIANKKVRKYVVDFPEESVLNCENIIVLPHLGASTEEAEDNCAIMASQQLVDFLENGNVVNSVNFPKLVKERTGAVRTTVTFKEEAKGIIDSLEGDKAVAIRKGYGYAIIDTDSKIDITGDGILKVRTL